MNDFEKVVNPGRFMPYANNRQYPVFMRITYKEGSLSISGVEGPSRSGNASGGCGQITDFELSSLSDGWTTKSVETFRSIWKLYHLNDMQAGCVHQRTLGWTWDTHPGEACPICDYKYGTAWLRKDVPAWALDYLRALPSSELTPAWV